MGFHSEMVAMDVDAAPACAGSAEQLVALPVASRVNFEFFQKAEIGSTVRVGGRLAGAAENHTLLTTDGGSLTVQSRPELPLEGGSAFVELVGTKAGAAELRVAGRIALPPGEVDVEL